MRRKRGRGGIEEGSGRTGASRARRVCFRRDVGGSVLSEDRAPSGRDVSGPRKGDRRSAEPRTGVAQQRRRSSGAASVLTSSGQPVVEVFTTRPGVRTPTTVDGVRVHAVVTGMIVARSAKLRYPRPVPIGVSTGLADVATGTLGARVTNGANVYALSNNHVFAGVNAASIGDPSSSLAPSRTEASTLPTSSPRSPTTSRSTSRGRTRWTLRSR